MSYEPHEEFNLPPESAKVWRYMSLTKLLSLLETARLFFSRVDLLGDPWEGSVSSSTIKAEQAHNQGVVDLLVNSARVPPDDEERLRWQVSPERLATFRRNMRAVSYASCWHVSSGESAAMWSQYGRTDAGLAVQSTVGRLLNSITDQERVFAGTVTYTDYRESTFTPRTTLMRPLLLKRNSFAHEHEFRCLVTKRHADFATDGFDKDSMPTGVRVAVDVDKLVERVHVAPTLPTWVREMVDAVLRRYKLSASVEQSALDAEPIF